MKKTELIHLHALLVVVAEELHRRERLTPDELEPYFALGVTPTNLRARRDEHERAVLTLARLLGEASTPVVEVESSEV